MLVGNIHFFIIFIFRLSVIANVLDLGVKSLSTQENPVAEFSRSNFAKMNISDKLSTNTDRILLESGELDNSRSSYPALKFGSPHPLHSFASNPCRGKCRNRLKLKRNRIISDSLVFSHPKLWNRDRISGDFSRSRESFVPLCPPYLRLRTLFCSRV